MSRIGIIREAIAAEGGNPNLRKSIDYFADGPNIHAGRKQRRAKEAIYKIDKHADGLTDEARKRVVEALRKHPDVKTAYLSRVYDGTKGHLKVVFQN